MDGAFGIKALVNSKDLGQYDQKQIKRVKMSFIEVYKAFKTLNPTTQGGAAYVEPNGKTYYSFTVPLKHGTAEEIAELHKYLQRQSITGVRYAEVQHLTKILVNEKEVDVQRAQCKYLSL